MNWQTLLTTLRTGQSVENVNHARTEFQRDYDRMIFSSPFRRLQNKTQVFPLPGSIFVHNRLTHSLEVASVGRSLGNNIANELDKSGEAEGCFYQELGSIVAAACIAHDMGNPPFGHSGERAISHYFTNGNGANILANSDLTEAQKCDLTNFDGNANTFRLLTHAFSGRWQGGFALTYPTVAAIIKYPRSSVGVKKFGYFQQDKEEFCRIMDFLGLRNAQTGEYCRHPLVYLVEAADDICYEIMDIEDSYRLGILSYDEIRALLSDFFAGETAVNERIAKVFEQVSDRHEQIAYLRSIVIGRLVMLCTKVFWDNREAILEGTFGHSLIDCIGGQEQKAMAVIKDLAISQIYRHQMVVEIELSGFTIMNTLLDKFINAINNQKIYYSTLLKPFISEQFRIGEEAPLYDKLLSAVDIVSGMTDVYALDLYKKIQGIGI